MAPQKLTDVCLESIVWNKVPVELQQEVKEIPTDGSVNALLQKLLRAETVIKERAQQSKAFSSDSMLRRSTSSQNKNSTEVTARSTGVNKTVKSSETNNYEEH